MIAGMPFCVSRWALSEGQKFSMMTTKRFMLGWNKMTK
jgi:hypothetical protein